MLSAHSSRVSHSNAAPHTNPQTAGCTRSPLQPGSSSSCLNGSSSCGSSNRFSSTSAAPAAHPSYGGKWAPQAAWNTAQGRRTACAVVVSTPGFTDADAQLMAPVRNAKLMMNQQGQRGWVQAMELDTLSPDMPRLLKQMGINYDPVRLAQVLDKSPRRVALRALRIAAGLGGFIAALLRDYATGNLTANATRRATELRSVLGSLGPSFVKIGQALSARPDLLPQVYLEVLSGLQDRLPSFSNEVAFNVIESELGRPVEKLFAELSASPVAAASLGQVYKGRLLTGELVAVKVQRPSIGDSIAIDMLLLRRLMGVIDANIDAISQPLVPLVDEFARRLFSELDYVMEGQNCEKFQELYGSMPRVRTPSIYWALTSRRVLTMEWIDGVKLTNRAAMDAAGLKVVDFVDVGIECTMRQLLEHGYFHADPHPGNLLATPAGDLVYLDFGMMSEAPQYARFAIIAHVVHLVNRDYDAMCRDYYTLQFMDPSIDTAPIAPSLAAFFDNVLDQSVTQLNFKAIVDGLGDVLFKFPFRVPAYYALILRSLTVLEGLALQADPNYKLLAKAYPYMARRLLTDPAPELRSSFEELVIKDGQLRWSRFEDLLAESSKSQGFDSSQMWLLADWLVTPSAAGVRSVVVQELARMIDAWGANNTRRRILSRTGNPELAERLVPTHATDADALQRASLLMDSISKSMPASPQTTEGWYGTGRLGSWLPTDAGGLMSWLTSTSSSGWPRMRALLRTPGGQEMVRMLSTLLGRRIAARAIKTVLGATSPAGSAAPTYASSGAVVAAPTPGGGSATAPTTAVVRTGPGEVVVLTTPTPQLSSVGSSRVGVPPPPRPVMAGQVDILRP